MTEPPRPVTEKQRRRAELAQWYVLELYGGFAVGWVAIIVAFRHSWSASRNPVVAALIVVLFAGVLSRKRQAWLLLVLLDLFLVICCSWEWSGVLPFAWCIAALLLLISPPITRYVRADWARLAQP